MQLCRLANSSGNQVRLVAGDAAALEEDRVPQHPTQLQPLYLVGRQHAVLLQVLPQDRSRDDLCRAGQNDGAIITRQPTDADAHNACDGRDPDEPLRSPWVSSSIRWALANSMSSFGRKQQFSRSTWFTRGGT